MRLIDADKLTNKIDAHVINNQDIMFIRKLINETETEEVAPAVHAHWVEKVGMQPVGQHGEHYCSACSGCALRGRPGSGRDIQTKFCPHCGAKMDEEVEP